MKINILFPFKDGAWGGGNQFLKALKKYFISEKKYEEDANKADVILVNSHHQIAKVLAFKLFHSDKIIVHRLDGPIQTVRGINTGLDRIIYLLNMFVADASIFQSEWSRYKNYTFGLKKNSFETSIVNAPDAGLFNRSGKISFDKKQKVRLISTSWSGNRNKGFEVYQWLDNHLDFNKYKMTFIGNSPIAFENIHVIPPINSKALATELKKHDIYLTASKQDPCSNALIEALHCGLPALAFNDGGHPEIIGKGGALFSQPQNIPWLIDYIVQDYYYYQDSINLASIESVGQEYFDFMFSLYEETKSGRYKTKKTSMNSCLNVLIAFLIWRVKTSLDR